MDVLSDPKRPHRRPLQPITPIERPKGCDVIGLVLQGGGALGAYQAGVYQALHEAGLEPDWVAGVSIGAVNSAIIAGNKPEHRVEKLEKFWLDITARDPYTSWFEGDNARKLRNGFSAMHGMVFGQPGFFRPVPLSGFMAPRGARFATAMYDTSPLHQTLQKLADFKLINEGPVRLAVGAVNVESANFIYFDNTTHEMEPEHIMASGALPPGLPMVRIGRHHYWDGGLVSNTPLQYFLDNIGSRNLLAFQVDLFSAHGSVPRDMPEVLSRQKDIQYSSRTRTTTDHFLQTHQLKQALREALAKVPEAELSEEQRAAREELRTLPEINIMQLIYQQKAYEGDAKDYEFSRISMKEHWRTGYYDTRNTLRHTDWMKFHDKPGIRSFDLHKLGE
ncbi:patatin-like phospholipase family protein [Acidocella aminolytica]|jgi:NTE family protein|uniref:Phospholipase n=1 Tax=Acidocella aminolytica 101 = DSM 11237 TaxID=1120923 RepID=A0A0D6PIM5_9PROT|nr:patatin-like phospholipase family protein [Acidocella aminolytica]GAN81073.1 phospholipase [Acidocella aminolytica 101 = DSM 11237]GBQ41520.1 putative esterase [Acidocella aminolytica 101 = DSM 11237]SHF12880.1 NTE family protein [Acidocella aminolytica 101 = DSM 11237]